MFDTQTKSGFLKTWVMSFVIMATSPFWGLWLGYVTDFNFMFFLYVVPASFVGTVFIHYADKLFNFIERSGNATIKALILGLLAGISVGLILFLLLK